MHFEFELSALRHLEIEAKEGQLCRATSWPRVERADQPSHLSNVVSGGFAIVRMAEPQAVAHESGSRRVLYQGERLALVRECLQLPDSVWVVRVSFLVYVAPGHGTGCGI